MTDLERAIADLTSSERMELAKFGISFRDRFAGSRPRVADFFAHVAYSLLDDEDRQKAEAAALENQVLGIVDLEAGLIENEEENDD